MYITSNLLKPPVFSLFSSSSKSTSSSSATPSTDTELKSQIALQATKVRDLKAAGRSKADVAPDVAELLRMKALLAPAPAPAPSPPPPPPQKTSTSTTTSTTTESISIKITPRSEDYSQWYLDIIAASQLSQNSPTRGCMIIRPLGMGIWENLKSDLDGRIKSRGVESCYFPMMIPLDFLTKEAEHVDGFAKECAVVTHSKLIPDPLQSTNLIPDPASKIHPAPYVLRPTSETIIWSTLKDWIVSHRDLPLKLNQWANVLRWELRTRPFLRTSEFLWQEGHTAFATGQEAEEDAREMSQVYGDFVEDCLAVRTVRGVKSPNERFAGALETFTIEGVMQNGWGLQMGTSHYLGQNFGKAFGVEFMNQNNARETVWGASWGVSTRLIGGLIMSHSDDIGLVLPPKIAPVQVVVVPIYKGKKSTTEDDEKMKAALAIIKEELESEEIRVKIDDRDYMRNGAKYFEWERKGVPLRIEVGPRDLEQGVCMMKTRIGPEEKEAVEIDLIGNVGARAKEKLDMVQSILLQNSDDNLERMITKDYNEGFEKFAKLMKSDEAGKYDGSAGLFLLPWKCDSVNEEKIKEECKATIRCYPIEENERGDWKGLTCFYSGEEATHMALFGRAF